jgi:hypothetical protein
MRRGPNAMRTPALENTDPSTHPTALISLTTAGSAKYAKSVRNPQRRLSRVRHQQPSVSSNQAAKRLNPPRGKRAGSDALIQSLAHHPGNRREASSDCFDRG